MSSAEEVIYDSRAKKISNPIEPTHYTDLKITPLEYIEANEEYLTWNLCNVIKYVSRHKMKKGLEDLKKAEWYLKNEIKNWESK
jgi:hypothetical protein